VTVVLLAVAPGTADQLGFTKLAVASKAKPVALASREIVIAG